MGKIKHSFGILLFLILLYGHGLPLHSFTKIDCYFYSIEKESISISQVKTDTSQKVNPVSNTSGDNKKTKKVNLVDPYKIHFDSLIKRTNQLLNNDSLIMEHLKSFKPQELHSNVQDNQSYLLLVYIIVGYVAIVFYFQIKLNKQGNMLVEQLSKVLPDSVVKRFTTDYNVKKNFDSIARLSSLVKVVLDETGKDKKLIVTESTNVSVTPAGLNTGSLETKVNQSDPAKNGAKVSDQKYIKREVKYGGEENGKQLLFGTTDAEYFYLKKENNKWNLFVLENILNKEPSDEYEYVLRHFYDIERKNNPRKYLLESSALIEWDEHSNSGALKIKGKIKQI